MFNRKNKQPKLDPLQQKRLDEKEKEESRRGQILKERIYPLLLEDNEAIANTKIFLQAFEVALNQSFMRKRVDIMVSNLGLEEELKNNPEAGRYRKMFGILNLETVECASDLLRAMSQIIDNSLHDENKERKMSELKLKYFHGN